MNKQTMKSGRCLVAVFILALILLLRGTTVQSQDLQWAKRDSGSAFDNGSGIAVDVSGNSYVTGLFGDFTIFGPGEANQTILTSAGGSDIFVAKYNSDGDLQWAKRAGGSSTINENGFGIAVDPSGNCYVTGLFGSSATFGPGEANQTILTSAGSDDIFVAKYNSSGDLQWARQAGGLNSEQGFGIAVDASGNSYVTGRFIGSATFGPGEANQTLLTSAGSIGIFMAKYNSSGDLLWAKRAGGSSFDFGNGIAVDDSGNSYVTGVFASSATFGPGEANQIILTSAGSIDIFVAKYNNNGELLWAKRAGGSSFDNGRGIAVDASGNGHVTGIFRGSATFGPGEANRTILTSAGGDDIFVAKYNNNGDLLWAKRAGSSSPDLGNGIAVDALGNSHVTGTFQSSATFGPGGANQTILTSDGFTDIFIAKYNDNGVLLWAKKAGGPSSEVDVGSGVAVDASGDSYVTGRFVDAAIFGPGEANQTILGSDGSADIFVAKFGSTVQNKIELLTTNIDVLLAAGAINSGQANSLIKKLEEITKKLNQGNTTAAINNLETFINQVEAFINGGVLTATEGQPLIDTANSIIDQINNALVKQGDVGDESISEFPEDFVLQQNYPNPFNPITKIGFLVPQAGEVNLKIYNLRGQLIRTLYSGAITAGQHNVVWDGKDSQGNSLPSGIYFFKLEANELTQVKKMNLLK